MSLMGVFLHFNGDFWSDTGSSLQKSRAQPEESSENVPWNCTQTVVCKIVAYFRINWAHKRIMGSAYFIVRTKLLLYVLFEIRVRPQAFYFFLVRCEAVSPKAVHLATSPTTTSTYSSCCLDSPLIRLFSYSIINFVYDLVWWSDTFSNGSETKTDRTRDLTSSTQKPHTMGAAGGSMKHANAASKSMLDRMNLWGIISMLGCVGSSSMLSGKAALCDRC